MGEKNFLEKVIFSAQNWFFWTIWGIFGNF